MKEYIIFGCGKIGRAIYKQLGQKAVFGFCDNWLSKRGETYDNKAIISFDELEAIASNYIILCMLNEINLKEVEQQLYRAQIYHYLTYEEFQYAKEQFPDSTKLRAYLSESVNLNLLKVQFYKEKCDRLEEKVEYVCRHTDVADVKQAEGYVRERQLAVVQFAQNFIEKYLPESIHPFLIAGNLLGEYRCQGFIPWDDDIDFGLIREEYDEFFRLAKEKFPVCICDESNPDMQKWVDMCTQKYANQYILFVYHNMIQISRGSNALDRLAVDFFAYDYMEEDASFEAFTSYVNKIMDRFSEKAFSEREKYYFIKEEKEKGLYTKEYSDKIYFGIDNMDVVKKKHNHNWIEKETLFPLKKCMFEGKEFWRPNHMEDFLKYEYADYQTYPPDFAENPHRYWEKYIETNYLNVEFYLVDSFEIYHFAPYYKLFRKNGANAVFVAENNRKNVSGKWFDYEEAIKILNELGYKYKTICNPNAQIAMTTQDAENLRKYGKETYRVHINYGYGLIRNSYAFSERTTRGFQACVIQGEFQRKKLQKVSGSTKLISGGFPKHFGHKLPDQKTARNAYGINASRKVLLYFPTWDEDCGVMQFGDEIKQLRKTYFIVTKMHHVLERDADKNLERRKISEFSDVILPADCDIETAVAMADYILADAKSGAAMEAAYLNNTVPLALLTVREPVEDWFYPEIEKLGPVVTAKDSLTEKMAECQVEKNWEERKKILETCYGKPDYPYLEEVIHYLMDEKSRV